MCAVLYPYSHPTTSWENLGTFRARQLRDLQSFTVKDGPFTKYVKIEILSHYGSEHYCPLTLLRYGARRLRYMYVACRLTHGVHVYFIKVLCSDLYPLACGAN